MVRNVSNKVFWCPLILAVNVIGVATCSTFERSVEQGSQRSLEITQFSYGELTVKPGDIYIPPRPSTAQVSFFVNNPENRQQACSGSVSQQQNGEWQDADGTAWFKCGDQGSTPDPDCLDCTHYQFDWGHEGWRFAVNQTWPSASNSIFYKVSGSTTLDPECTESTEISYRSCTAPDFSLNVELYD
ncbi:hypothetical protein F5B19DRAFT_260346 [Rostrohypoxylon terebratum]|nr:hypothetical protein F5B19DRAFT_260346 [Rostrohypoxylon terebratum]